MVSVLDVMEGRMSPTEVLEMELPMVNDLLKAKVRLERAKAEARRRARELEAINSGKGKTR